MQWPPTGGRQQYLAQPGSPQSLNTAMPAAASYAQGPYGGNQGTTGGDLQHRRFAPEDRVGAPALALLETCASVMVCTGPPWLCMGWPRLG